MKNQASLKQTLKDLKATLHLVDNTFIIRESEKHLKLLEQQIKQTEKQIESTIKAEELLEKNFKLIKSVPGIGLVTAVAVLLSTSNFTAFEGSRKYASYCGVAPFPYTSGTTIRGRTQTSSLANHRIKALLSNCAGHPVPAQPFSMIRS